MGISLRVFLDTNVFLYATGAQHAFKDSCRQILRAAGEGRFEAVVNVEVLQEYVHVRTRKGIDRERSMREASDLISACRVADVTMANFQVALRIFATVQEVSLRDAMHVASSLSELVDAVVSADTGFDSVPGLSRVGPEEFAAGLVG